MRSPPAIERWSPRCGKSPLSSFTRGERSYLDLGRGLGRHSVSQLDNLRRLLILAQDLEHPLFLSSLSRQYFYAAIDEQRKCGRMTIVP